jgi:hypothetical protein
MGRRPTPPRFDRIALDEQALRDGSTVGGAEACEDVLEQRIRPSLFLPRGPTAWQVYGQTRVKVGELFSLSRWSETKRARYDVAR